MVIIARTSFLFTVVFFLALGALTFPAVAGPKVIAYVPNWIDLPAFAEGIDYGKVTHLNVAFENPKNEEGDLSFNKGDAALVEKGHAHHIPVLVSIGGGAASGDKKLQARYFELLTDAKRAGFVAKLVSYVEAHQFDGLDVDIEGPSINKDYGAFIHDLGVALKPKGKLLTAALSQGYGGANVPDSVFEHFDFVNIMAYDGRGPWDPNAPGQHSSMKMAQGAAAYWVKRGLAKEKAVLGVPFYGYGFGKAFKKRDYPYKDIVAEFPGAEKLDQTGETVWYNGIPTIKAKAKFTVDEGLAGVMIWSLDEDAPGDKSLLNAIQDGFVGK